MTARRAVNSSDTENDRREIRAGGKQQLFRFQQYFGRICVRFRRTFFRHDRTVVLPVNTGAAGVDEFSRRTIRQPRDEVDRKSTRLNSSHANISYAVFCLKKK